MWGQVNSNPEKHRFHSETEKSSDFHKLNLIADSYFFRADGSHTRCGIVKEKQGHYVN
jgi:hypothetical protein